MTRPKLQLQKQRGVCPHAQKHLIIFLQDASSTIYCYFLTYFFPHTHLHILASRVWCFSSYIKYWHNPSFHLHQLPPSLLAEPNLVSSSQLFTNTVFLWQSLSFPHSPYTERFSKYPFVITVISPPSLLLFSFSLPQLLTGSQACQTHTCYSFLFPTSFHA